MHIRQSEATSSWPSLLELFYYLRKDYNIQKSNYKTAMFPDSTLNLLLSFYDNFLGVEVQNFYQKAQNQHKTFEINRF